LLVAEYVTTTKLPNKLNVGVTLWTDIEEVLGSNLYQDTYYPD
jgi:hypothetical protein